LPRLCTICASEHRAAVDKGLVEGVGQRVLASQYGFSQAAVNRHRPHLSKTIVSAKERQVAKSGRTALETFQAMVAMAEAKVTATDGMLQAVWYKEWRGMMELGFKLGMQAQAEKHGGPLHQHPSYITLRCLLFDTLADYPEARVKLAEALLKADLG
jgi:hypothetical protein